MKFFMKVIMVLMILSNFVAGSGPNLERCEDQLKSELQKIKEEIGFPGATLAVVLPDGKEVTLAVGLADKETSTLMQPNDRIFTGSIGKTFVAALVLKLIEEKKLSLTDKVASYFKKASWFCRIPNAKYLTIHMLLNHTTGIPRHIFTKGFLENLSKDPERTWKPEELLAFILDKKPIHEAGQGWAYSDTNYIILGMVIEKVTGNLFYDEVKKRLLEPLKLKSTAAAVGRCHPGLVSGYTGEEPFGLPEKVADKGKYVINPQFEWTGGGFVSDSLDLARWAKVLYGGQFLSQESKRIMLFPLDYKSGKPAKVGYGLGVQVWDSVYGPVFGHGGIFPGYQSQMAYLPKYDFSIALQINSDRTLLKKAKDLYLYFSRFYKILAGYLEKQEPKL